VAAARASIPAETAQRLAPVAGPPAVRGSLTGIDHLYWQEQIHIFSAQHLVEGTGVARLALIAGRANPDHPALAGASMKQFDVRREVRESPPDDFTTALASLLVGNGNASPYRGIAPQAHLLILQILDDQGVSTTWDLLVAVDLAIREGADVICLPLGYPAESGAERRALKRAAKLGVLVVCPAGNDGDDKPTYPAAYPECLSAGVVDYHNRLASFSNFGDWVTTAAPGVDILAAVGEDGYRKGSGSSYACAILAGIVTLMVEANPNLTAERAKEILSTIGSPLLTDTTNQQTGDLKVVDASEAVLRARS
jgi:subtilisin family serine protease